MMDLGVNMLEDKFLAFNQYVSSLKGFLDDSDYVALKEYVDFLIYKKNASVTGNKNDVTPLTDPQEIINDELWERVKEDIRSKTSDDSFDTWFLNTKGSLLDDSTMLIYCHSAFQKDWLRSRFDEMIMYSLNIVLGHMIEIKYEVREPQRI